MLFSIAALVSSIWAKAVEPGKPKVVVVFSGKRKSGKDYVTDIIHHRLQGKSHLFRLSGPLKAQFALDHGLDLEKLLSASEYKEKYRYDMIKWGEEQRRKDPGYFCRLATKDATNPVWIITDARRPSDVTYFKQRYKLITVRVTAPDKVRQQRGWIFTEGVDDAESECALDKGIFDVIIPNSGNDNDLTTAIDNLCARIKKYL